MKKACKGGIYPKSSSVSSKLGSYGKKMKSGGSLGMKSVKAGFDKNPGVTRADIIVAAKKKAQNGRRINVERKSGSDPLSEYRPKISRGSGNIIPVGAKKHPKTGTPLKKSKGGGKMTKKCKYGCK